MGSHVIRVRTRTSKSDPRTESLRDDPSRNPGVNFINIKCTNFSYEHRFGTFYYIHVTRKKLPKQCSNEKFAHLTLMKLTPGVNFINILQAAFFYKRVFTTFLWFLHICVCNFFLSKENQFWLEKGAICRLKKIG